MAPLGDDLVDRVLREFDEHGQAAVQALRTAQAILCSDLPEVHMAAAAACSLRNAMDAILRAAQDDHRGWDEVARAAVESYDDTQATDHDPQGYERAKHTFEARMDGLRLFLEAPPKAAQQLSWVMTRITGQPPRRGQHSAFDAFIDLRGRLNGIVHGGVARSSGEELWNGCIDSFQGLFGPPSERGDRLVALARREPPDADMVAEVAKLAHTPIQLKIFLDAVESFAWIEALWRHGLLNPPHEPGLWPSRDALIRLHGAHPDAVVGLLRDMYHEHADCSESVAHIARAARLCGGSALGIVVEALTQHRSHRGIVWMGVEATHVCDASDPLVYKIADIVLNEDVWDVAQFTEPLLERFLEGADASNAEERCGLLIHKLAKLSPDDQYLWRLRFICGTRIDETEAWHEHERPDVIVAALLSLISRSWESLDLEWLLDQADRCDQRLSRRLRAWLLAHAPDAAPRMMLDEIAQAITAGGSPTAEGIALVDRAVETAGEATVATKATIACGPAPTMAEVGAAVASGTPPYEWAHCAAWLSLLPPATHGEWSAPAAALVAEYGLGREMAAGVADGGDDDPAPFTVDELNAGLVADACRQVARWRPAPTAWPRGPQRLAQVLQDAVLADPDRWVADPIAAVVGLAHPLYISSYLQAVAELAPSHDLPAARLVEAMQYIGQRSGPVADLDPHAPTATDETAAGASGSAWDHVRRASIDLVRALVCADWDFGDQTQAVWQMLTTATADCRLHESDSLHLPGGAYSRAINQTCTRALQTVLLWAARTYATRGSVPREALAMCDAGLHIEGRHGEDHRAALAPHIPFLADAAPEWFKDRHDGVFGVSAPAGLSQALVDATLQWPAGRWVLEHTPGLVRDAVARGSEGSMDCMFVGMLLRIDGWSPTDNLGLLMSAAARVTGTPSGPPLNDAARSLAALLRRSGTDASRIATACEFWRAALDTRDASVLHGFGWFALLGELADPEWEELTLQTLQQTGGRIEMIRLVLKRVVREPMSDVALAILNLLVRGSEEPWEQHTACEMAVSALPESTTSESGKQLRDALAERGYLG